MREGAVAVLAKAPVAGFAKTRLIPLLGAEGAARLQERLIRGALATALEARVGPVTLWCAPDTDNALFQEAARRPGIDLAVQPAGDLGVRMLAAFRAAPAGRVLLLIGTDCPVLTAADLMEAMALLSDADAVMAPAEDGGYGLIAAPRPIPELFERMPWGTDCVAALIRERARACGLRLAELRMIWDVDTASDFERLCEAGLLDVADIRIERASRACST
jgi:rSAM/selenodomain-associated transferase 1